MDNPASRPDYTRLLTNSPFAKAGAAALQDILPLARLFVQRAQELGFAERLFIDGLRFLRAAGVM